VGALRRAAGDRAWWTLSPFDANDEDVIRIEADPVPTFVGIVERSRRPYRGART